MSKRRPKAASFSSRVCPPTGEVSVGRCMASVCGMGPKLRGTFGLVTRRPIQISSGLILGVLLGVLIPHGRSYGQAAQAETAGQWSASFGAGFLVPHRSVIRGLIEGHALRSELSWNSKAFGFWAAHRHQPRWGFSVIATDTGAPEHIGRQVAALSHVDLALHGRLHLRLGIQKVQVHAACLHPRVRNLCLARSNTHACTRARNHNVEVKEWFDTVMGSAAPPVADFLADTRSGTHSNSN